MNDTELDPAEETRLHALLQRAAAAVEVPRTPSLPAPVTTPPQRGRGPWVLAVAAAVALLLAGGLWVSRDTDGDRVDSGPANEDSVDDGDPLAMLDDLWVLPQERPGAPSVVQAASYTETTMPFWIAVDDPSAPTRWMAITTVGMSARGGGLEPQVLSDGSVVVLDRPASPEGSRWALLTAAMSVGHLSVVYAGVEDAEVLDHLERIMQSLAAQDTNLTDVDALNRTLAGWTPPAGLEPTWPADRTLAEQPEPQLSLQLEDTDGATLVVHTMRTGLPAAVAALELKFLLPGGLEDRSQLSYEELPELGPGSFAATRDGQLALYVFTPAGVRITVGEPDGTNGTSVETLVELARSLRPTTEVALGRELAARGVELQTIDASEEATTTTMESAPTTVG